MLGRRETLVNDDREGRYHVGVDAATDASTWWRANGGNETGSKGQVVSSSRAYEMATKSDGGWPLDSVGGS